MTEIKSLTEEEIATKLDLTDEEKEFLTDPYRSSFMTEFLIGSNKLKFYGYPLIMAKHSEFIKTSIPTLASSKPPYELFNFGQVYELSITLIWLELNEFNTFQRVSEGSKSITLKEWLQAYRLVGYLGINNDNDILVGTFYHFFNLLVDNELNEIKETLENKTDRSTIIKIINRWLHNQNYNEGERIFVKLQEHFPNLLTELNYIPVKINNIYVNYANKAVIDNPDLFLKYQQHSWVKEGDEFVYSIGFNIFKFTINRWGPNDINFNYTSPTNGVLNKNTIEIFYPVNPVP